MFVRGGHGLFGTIGDYFRFAQMLANGGQLDGTRILGRKTLALMHANHVPAALLPSTSAACPCQAMASASARGWRSTWRKPARRARSASSAGPGAAKTHYWVDPQEQMVGLFMTQSMMSFDLPELDLRALAYQAIEG